MQNLLEQYKNIKPSQAWVKNTEKELRAQILPVGREGLRSAWPIYSVIFVLTLTLFLSLATVPENEKEPIKLIQEQEQQKEVVQKTPEQTKQEIKATIQKATKVAKQIENKIEEKIMAVKTQSSKNDRIDPLAKLLEDLEKIKTTRGLLEEIEKDIENGDYLIAREKLNRYLDSLKVDSEKEEIIINQE